MKYKVNIDCRYQGLRPALLVGFDTRHAGSLQPASADAWVSASSDGFGCGGDGWDASSAACWWSNQPHGADGWDGSSSWTGPSDSWYASYSGSDFYVLSVAVYWRGIETKSNGRTVRNEAW